MTAPLRNKRQQPSRTLCRITSDDTLSGVPKGLGASSPLADKPRE